MKINATQLVGGTSRFLNFDLPPYTNIISQNLFLYYKISGSSGNNKVITFGAYIEATVKAAYATPDETPAQTDEYLFGPNSWLQVNGHPIFTYGEDTEIQGSLVSWEVVGKSDTPGVPYPYNYYVTYRYWLGRADNKWPELILSATETSKLTLSWCYTGWYGTFPGVRDSDNIYLSFTNAPYINYYPAEITDESSFTIEYLVPKPSDMDYISFGVLDNSGNLLSGYKIAPNNATSYRFSFSEYDLEAIYAKYNTVNMATVQLGIRYKNLNGDPILVTYPMLFEIVIDKPYVRYTIKDIDPAAVRLTGNDQVIVRNRSDIQIAIDPQANKGASISSFYIAQGTSKTYNQTVVTYNNVTAYQFSVYAVDSRGNSTLQNITLPMVDYFPVTCNIAAEPPRTDGHLSVSISGRYWNNNFGVANNTIRFEYKYTSNIVENNIGWTRLEPTPTLNINQGNYTAYFDIIVPNHADTYTVQVRAIDELSSAESNSVTVKSTPVFDWGQEDFKFNVPVMIQGDLTVTGTINGSGASAADCIVEQGTITTGSGNSQANWVYRKWNSGIAECWCRKHVSTAVNTAWGNLYVSGALSYTNITWGVNFIDIPVANITIAPNASGAFLIAGGSTSLTKTNTGGYEIARGSALSSAGNFYINYYGIGKWK